MREGRGDSKVPQEQELCQSELFVWDKHSHTYQHLKRCKLQYLVDNQHPENMSQKITIQ